MHGAFGEGYSCEGKGGGCEHSASAFLPVVCFTASPATAMMTSKAAVVWHGETKQPNPPEGESPKWSPAAQLLRNPLMCAVGQDSATERRRRSPLRAIKYSSGKRHRARRSIPTECSHDQETCSKKKKNNNKKEPSEVRRTSQEFLTSQRETVQQRQLQNHFVQLIVC